MGTNPILVVAAFCGTMLCAAAASAQAWSCDGGAVEMGASKYEVRTRCGEPALVDVTRVTRVAESGDDVLTAFVEVEDWLYDPGPNRLVVVLTFEEGRLIGVRAFGYGRAPGARPSFDKVVALGEPAVRVLFLYGPPADVEERIETVVVSRKGGGTYPRQRTVATWTYNLGPNRFMRIYRFLDGRLNAIEQGPRGF